MGGVDGRAVTVMALVAAGAVSCLSRPALVPQLFTIDPPPPAERVASPGGRWRAVEVRRVNVAAPFDGRELVYRTSRYRLERDPYATLAATPATLLAEAVRAHIGQAGFVREASEGSEAHAPGLLMDVDVRELSGDFVHPERPAAVIVVAFEVSAPGAASLLFRKVYTRRMALPRRTADAVITAWNEGLAEVLGELERDLEAALFDSASPLGPSGQ